MPGQFSNRRFPRRRQLHIETLEQRSMLNAAPVGLPDSYSVIENQSLIVEAPINSTTTAANLQLESIIQIDYGISKMVYSSDYGIIAGLSNSNLYLFDHLTGDLISSTPAVEKFTDLDLTPDGRYLFVADYGGTKIGYGSPLNPSYVHRYDMVTKTWETKVTSEIAYHIEAITGTRFLLKEIDQSVNITLNDFGASPSDPTTTLSDVRSVVQAGDFEYDPAHNRIFHADPQTYGKIAVYDLVGDTFVANGTITIPKSSSLPVISTDGNRLYFGTRQFLTSSLTSTTSLGSVVLSGVGDVAFGDDGAWNAFTGKRLNIFPVDFELETVSADKKWFLGADLSSSSNRTIYRYRIPGSVPGVLANDTDQDGDTLTATVVTAPAHGTLNLLPNGYFQYTPAANYFGPDSFTYVAADGTVASDPVTVNLQVWPLFVDADSSPRYNVNEDTTLNTGLSSGLLNGAVDHLGNPLTVILDSTTQHGTLTLAADGSFQYVPTHDYFGLDRFTYRVISGVNSSSVGTIVINVNLVQDPPASTPDSYFVRENGQLIVDLPVNASSTQASLASLQQNFAFAYNNTVSQIKASAAATAIAVRQGKLVTIFDQNTGQVRAWRKAQYEFTDLDFSPDGRYLYVADYGGTASQNVPAQPSIIQRYDFLTGTWEQKSLNAIAYQIEAANGTRLVVKELVGVVNFRLLDFGATSADPISIVKTFSYLTSGDFEYDANSGYLYHGNSDNATKEFHVYRILGDTIYTNNGRTTAQTGNNTTLSEDGKYFYFGNIQYDALAYPYNAVRSYTNPVVAATGNLVFTDNSNGSYYNALSGVKLGELGFTPTAVGFDDQGQWLWAYNPVLKQIVQFSVPGAEPSLLENDFDVDLDSFSIALVTTTAHGQLNFNTNGTFQYVPNPGFTGADTFVYRATDSVGNTSDATVTINVLPSQAPPTAGTDNYAIAEDTTLAPAAIAGLLANDNSAIGQPLTVTDFTLPAHGTLTVLPDGSFTYTPVLNYYGADSFSYFVTDGVTTNIGHAFIDVQNVSDPPTVADESYTTNEDTALAVSTSRNVLTNDINYDPDALTAVLVAQPANGSVTLNSNGTFSFTPAANFAGVTSFTYRAKSGTALSSIATVTITVNPVNDAPTAVADTYLLPFSGTGLTIPANQGVLANDFDVDGNPFTAVLVAAPTAGTLTLNSDGSFTYTRGANFAILDTFTYRARDASVNSATQTVRIELDTGRINVGNFTLIANTPNQQIPLYFTGNAPLNGFNLRLQVGDGNGSLPEPIISSISYADTIWSGSPTQILGGPIAGSQQFVQSSIVFQDAAASVLSNGKLVTLTVDTTGIYGGSYALLLKGTQIGQDTDLLLAGGTGASSMFITNGTITVTPAAVTLRQTFYNNSYFDGFDSAITAADLTTALAPNKFALRPGQAASFSNYTSYSKGINGIVIEVENIQYQPLLSEFEFRTGNSNTPSSWTLLSTPPTMTVESISAGKVRIYFTWPDNTITKKWLEVLVKAKGPMGLPLDDVFYFGNAIGDVGNQFGNTYVDGTDFTYTRDNKHNFLNRATITDPADFNRDSLVDATDLGFARDNSTNFLTSLLLFTPPAHTTPNRTPYVPPTLAAGLQQEASLTQTTLLADNRPAEQSTISTAVTENTAILPSETVELTDNTATFWLDSQPPLNQNNEVLIQGIAYANWLANPYDESIDLMLGKTRKKPLSR